MDLVNWWSKKDAEAYDKVKNALIAQANAHEILPGKFLKGELEIGEIMGDAVVAQRMSQKLLERGIYAIGFFYPVVPKGKARIRTQISAAHTQDDLDKAIAAFAETYKEVTA